ncbi:MAG TPA: peptidylprolyl isomerase [Steroidobacteraceae bacterium]|nr:peptidylprolyl isomerase [Steroidobacteraceae bacterium]
MISFRRTPSMAISIALALLALGACQKTQQAAAPATPAPAADASPPVAVVNGTPINRDEYDTLVRELLHGKQQELTPEQKNQVLDQLIRINLVAAQADKDGLDKDPEALAQLKLLRMQVLGDAEQRKFMKGVEPTDAELHAEYDADVGAMDKTEYKARHILVPTKDDAEKVIKRLQKGAKFEELAKTTSTDTSKNNGGDLGWFTSARMVKPFADAVKTLKKGEYTQAPVQTQFGWHVILLEDTRPLAPPPFDQVKGQLANSIKQKKWQAYLEDLEKKAKIEKKLT